MRSHHLRPVAGSGGAIVTDNLRLHYDFGDTNCYNNTENFSTYNSNRILIGDLTGNGHTMQFGMGATYGLNYQTSSTSSNYVTTQSGNGGHVIFSPTIDPSTLNPSDHAVAYRNTSPMTGLGLGDWTYEFWYNYYRTSGITYVDISQDNSDYSGNLEIYIHNGVFKAGIWGSYKTDNHTYSTVNGYNGWDHVVISKIGESSSNIKFYHNGVNTSTHTKTNFNYVKDSWGEPGSSAVTSGSIWNNMTMFGVYSQYRFTGKFAIHRVYVGKGLTSAEVLQNFNAQRSRFGV
tara:strand:- start:289 stop:1155 length:867 start_codon:yes stop_codon:yes gene_type:complete